MKWIWKPNDLVMVVVVAVVLVDSYFTDHFCKTVSHMAIGCGIGLVCCLLFSLWKSNDS